MHILLTICTCFWLFNICFDKGAGISTSAGIRDFRSGINTVLDTGGGAWAKNTAVKEGKNIPKPKRKAVNIQKAFPTAAHLSILELINRGLVKYIISQNCDGLHQRSGISKNKISELHGNSYLEICEKCNKIYMRDYKVRDSLKVQNPKEHETGRKCIIKNCNGRLKDTIVQFQEQLPEIPLERAIYNSKKSDLYISMGSSLAVSPACDMPRVVGTKWNLGSNKHNLVIINLQKTQLHDLCSLPIFAKIDDVMIALMNELKIEIPKFMIKRYIQIKIENIKDNQNEKRLTITQLHADGINFTFLDEITFTNNGEKIVNIYNNKRTNKAQDCVIIVPKWNKIQEIDGKNDEQNDEEKDECKNNKNPGDDKGKGLCMELSFFGNFREQRLNICLNRYLDDFIDDKSGKFIIGIQFDPTCKQWNLPNKQQQLKDETVVKLLKMDL